MEKLQNLIKLGLKLLDEFHRLDDEIISRRYLEHDNENDIRYDYNTLIKELEDFKTSANKFIDSSSDFSINGELLLLEAREREDLVEDEIMNHGFREFRSLGITVGQIVDKLDEKLKGLSSREGCPTCEFEYEAENKIIYKSEIGTYTTYKVRSRDMKREVMCDLVFGQKFNYVTAEEIEDKRITRLTKLYGHAEDLESKNPYQWIRRSCAALNKDIKENFKISYDLFETDPEHYSVRLNPIAKIKK